MSRETGSRSGRAHELPVVKQASLLRQAGPRALPLAIAAWEAFERLGSPEGELALAQPAVHLATAPKSNAVCAAFGAAMRAAKETGSPMSPRHILNAPTKRMQEIGYGAGYEYDHDAEEGISGQDRISGKMRRRFFCRPTDRAARRARSRSGWRGGSRRGAGAAGSDQPRLTSNTSKPVILTKALS